MSRYYLICILCCYIVRSFCADTAFPGQNLLKHNGTSPPHPRIKQFQASLPKPNSTTSQKYESPKALSLSEGISDSVQFETARSFFEYISSAATDPHATKELNMFCSQIPNGNIHPLDAYMDAYNETLIKKLETIQKSAAQIPAISPHYALANVNKLLKEQSLNELCKLAIYLAERLDFSTISAQTAPFQMACLSPAQQQSKHYCETIECQWNESPLQEDEEYYSSPERSHTTWIANLLIATNQCPINPELSNMILEAFIKAISDEKINKNRNEYINTFIEQLTCKRPIPCPAYLERIYHDALTLEFLCENKPCFVSRRLGYLAALLRWHQNSNPYNFAAKYFGLYQDPQNS